MDIQIICFVIFLIRSVVHGDGFYIVIYEWPRPLNNNSIVYGWALRLPLSAMTLLLIYQVDEL